MNIYHNLVEALKPFEGKMEGKANYHYSFLLKYAIVGALREATDELAEAAGIEIHPTGQAAPSDS